MRVLLKDVVNKSIHSVPGYLPLGLPCFSPFAVEFIKTHYQKKMGEGVKPHPEEIKKMASGVFSPAIGNVRPCLNWEAEKGKAWLLWENNQQRRTVDSI